VLLEAEAGVTPLPMRSAAECPRTIARLIR
jgi:hypothetical protein